MCTVNLESGLLNINL